MLEKLIKEESGGYITKRWRLIGWALGAGADSKNITLRNTHQFQHQPHNIPLTLS